MKQWRGGVIVGILILLLIGCGEAWAEDLEKGKGWFEWDRTNTYLHIPLTALMVVDLGQTIDGASDPQKYHDKNPILGEHPQEDDVWQYFAFSYLVITAIVYILPEPLSYIFQGGTIALELKCIAHNYSVGLSVRF